MDAIERFVERPGLWVVLGLAVLAALLYRWSSYTKPTDMSDAANQAERPLRLLMTATGTGVFVLLAYSFREGFGSGTLLIATTALALAGAAVVVGVILGFLFAIPKAQRVTVIEAAPPAAPVTLPGTDLAESPAPTDNASLLTLAAPATPRLATPTAPTTPNQPTPAQNPRSSVESRYEPNDNLEDISDWLTKILVGVGLTQLGSIVDFGRNLAAWSAPGLERFS